MRTRHGIALVAAALLAPTAGRGSELEAYSSTSLYVQKQWVNGDTTPVTPLYEFLSLSARDLAIPGGTLGIVVDAWGGVNLAGTTWWNGYLNTGGGSGIGQGNWSGDLNLAFLKGSWLDGDLQVKLGRQSINVGNSRMLQLDGLAVSSRFLTYLSLDAWGGAPTVQRFIGWGSVQSANPTLGDLAVGGRLGFAWRQWVNVGVSATVAWNGGDLTREDLALDLKFSPVSWAYLLGYLDWSLFAPDYAGSFGSQIPEANASVVLPVSPHLQFTADYGYTVPALMLGYQSILWVFTDANHQYLGGSVRFGLEQLGLRLPVDFDAAYRYIMGYGSAGNPTVGTTEDLSQTGNRITFRATWKPGRNSAVGAEGSWLDLPQQGYWNARVFGSLKMLGFTGTVDGQGYWFDQPVNGNTSSLVASATLGYELPYGLAVVGGVSGGQTPYYQSYFSGMVKLVYNQTYRFREVRP
jgi:hypothetical protein